MATCGSTICSLKRPRGSGASIAATPKRAACAAAKRLGNGRDSSLELVQGYHSPDMVVLAVIERTHVEVGGLAGQDWALQVTLVFRRDKDRWLLAHRHADPLVGGIALEEAAAMARAPVQA